MLTDFSQIIFNEQDHTYHYHGHALTGANKKIKELQKPFDRETAARRVADREGKTVEDVLLEWDAKGEIGRRKGSDVHAHIMKILTGGNGPIDDPFLVVNKTLPEISAFNDLWVAIRNEVTVDPDFIEWVVGDLDMRTAGTIDTMLLSKKTSLWHIWDWKTGKFETSNRFQKLLPPFDDLDDCQFQVFSLVTSLYRLMVERNRPQAQLGESYLVHLSSYGTYTVHKAIDYRARLFAWLGIPIID